MSFVANPFFLAVPAVRPPPMMRPAFVPHILQRPGNWPTIYHIALILLGTFFTDVV